MVLDKRKSAQLPQTGTPEENTPETRTKVSGFRIRHNGVDFSGDIKIPVRKGSTTEFCVVFAKDGIVVDTKGLSLETALKEGTMPSYITLFKK